MITLKLILKFFLCGNNDNTLAQFKFYSHRRNNGETSIGFCTLSCCLAVQLPGRTWRSSWSRTPGCCWGWSTSAPGRILYGQLLARRYQVGGQFTADAEVPAVAFSCIHGGVYTLCFHSPCYFCPCIKPTLPVPRGTGCSKTQLEPTGTTLTSWQLPWRSTPHWDPCSGMAWPCPLTIFPSPRE